MAETSNYGENVDNPDQQPAPPADGTVVTTNGAAGDNPAKPAEPAGDGAAATSDGAAAEATADGSSPASAMDVDGDDEVGGRKKMRSFSRFAQKHNAPFFFFFYFSGCVGPFGIFTYSLHLSSI